MTDALCAFLPDWMCINHCVSSEHVFGEYTVLLGGIINHTHAIEPVEITPTLHALGAVFAFTQKTPMYLHTHDDIYFVQSPTNEHPILTVYHLVKGAAVPTRVLNPSAWHSHPIHVIYTPSDRPRTQTAATSPSRRKRILKRRKKRSVTVADDLQAEFSDLMDIGKAMGTHTYLNEKCKTPNLDVDVCNRCSRVRRKRPTDVVLSHALLVYK